MTNNQPELLPCPFCGSPAHFWDGDWGFVEEAACCSSQSCGVYLDPGGPVPDGMTDKEFSTKAWNTRADLTPKWQGQRADKAEAEIADLKDDLRVKHWRIEQDKALKAECERKVEILINALNKINKREMGTAGNIAGAALKEFSNGII